MFERFDDPAGFRAGPRFHDGVRRRARAIRRRRRRLVTGLSVAVVAAGVGGAGALYVDRRDEAIDRVQVSTPAPVGDAVNILVLGTDAGLDEVARADSIAVLRLDDTGSHLVSIPRDLVDDATGRRLNEALIGGPQEMIDAVGRTTGIPVNHFVLLAPDGFAELVDAIGGLEVSVDGTYRDAALGVRLEPAACTTLDGDQALGLARSRHLEQQQAGGWVVDPTGDLGRMARQRAMLGAALDQLGTDPVTIDRLSRLLADHALLDAGLDLATVVDLGRRLADGPPLVTEAIPVDPDQLPNGAAVLRLAEGSEEVLARYGADGPEGVVAVGPRPTPQPAAFTAVGPCP